MGDDAPCELAPELARRRAYRERLAETCVDLGSRRVIGWSLADHLRSELVLHALQQALQTRSVQDTIFHSDRGSQYGSTLFRQALRQAGLRQSMSARANP